MHFPVFLQRTDAVKLGFLLVSFTLLITARNKLLPFIIAHRETECKVCVLFRKGWVCEDVRYSFLVRARNKAYLFRGGKGQEIIAENISTLIMLGFSYNYIPLSNH